MSAIVELHALQVRNRGNVLLGPLSLQLHAGQCTGLVGESGSGKSLTVQALLGLLPAGLQADGALHCNAEAIALGSSAHDALRGHVLGWVPQDPLASLHPLKRVGSQLVETLRALRGMTRAASSAEAHRLLHRVHLPNATAALRRYPHEFSGGQRQRIAIALALATSPRVLIADEPTSALDSRIAREVLDLLDTLRREEGLAILLVSHDLPLVGAYAQDVVVLHRGQVVERGAVETVFDAPSHPCTHELLAAGERHVDAAHDGARGALVLQASGLRLRYRGAAQDAVDGVDLQLHRGEALAVVGESGSGKSSLARVLLRLARAAEGRLVLHPREGAPVDLMGATASALRALRPRIGVVFQDPFASLDPRMRIVDVIGEPLRLLGAASRAARRTQVAALLQAVGLPEDALDRYPHEFSGGQRQRIAIARALASEPDLLVCDEAISALDAQHRGAILRLLARLKNERGLALVFITHDLDAAAAIAETIAVMEHGRIVETGPTAQVLAAPRHPHTRALVQARPAPRMRAN